MNPQDVSVFHVNITTCSHLQIIPYGHRRLHDGKEAVAGLVEALKTDDEDDGSTSSSDGDADDDDEISDELD